MIRRKTAWIPGRGETQTIDSVPDKVRQIFLDKATKIPNRSDVMTPLQNRVEVSQANKYPLEKLFDPSMNKFLPRRTGSDDELINYTSVHISLNSRSTSEPNIGSRMPPSRDREICERSAPRTAWGSSAGRIVSSSGLLYDRTH